MATEKEINEVIEIMKDSRHPHKRDFEDSHKGYFAVLGYLNENNYSATKHLGL